MFTVQQIEQLYGDELRTFRRTLHAHPELSQQEFRTTALIKEELESLGIEILALDIPTGVVGILRGGKPGKTIGIRADIDALPVEEDPSNPYCSAVSGCMHACGHDMHASFLLGAAKALSGRKEELCGTFVFLFQPAEENIFGARAMLDAGLLEKISFDAIIGGHVQPILPLGQVTVQSGPVMAAKDSFRIVIHGKGGHGAAPHMAHDPIVTAASVVSALQCLSSRERNPKIPSVISVCSIQGGNTDNIIPSDVTLLGSMRNVSTEQRTMLKQRLKETAEYVARGMGCSAEVSFSGSLPVLENSTAVSTALHPVISNLLGAENVTEIPCDMTSEDFSLFAEAVPSCFFFIGTTAPGSAPYPLHSSRYFPPEEAIAIGAAVYAESAAALAAE